MGSMSWVHWAIVLLIVLLVFGTKRLKGAGQDLGEAVKGLRKGLHGDEKPVETLTAADPLADARREAAAREAADLARREAPAAPRAGEAGYDDRTPRP